MSGILINDMSDHLPCISVLKNVRTRKGETITITKRNMKGDNLSQLKKAVANINWETVLCPNGTEVDVDEQFESLHNVLLTKLDEHCPEKTVTLSAKKILREPWLTKGLNKSYNKQRQLYKMFLTDRSETNERKYKVYRNTLQRIVRKEKQSFYNNQCLKFKANSKKLWETINRITKKKK